MQTKFNKKERQLLIMKEIKKERFNVRIFAQSLNVNKSTIERDLKDLKKQNKITFKGSLRDGSWEIL